MVAIVVCGGGVIGLSTGMMLAEDGHDVTVLEADPRDPPATPAEAWEDWRRDGVAQFRQPHNLFARFRAVADTELPGLTDGLLAAGCTWVDYLDALPPSIEDRTPRDDDDRIRFVTGRRPVTEAVVATAAQEHPRLALRRGVRATGLVAGPSAVPGVPQVAGVRTGDGEVLPADLVVDAMGRRTPSGDWLAELGARQPVLEREDSGFVYYTRYLAGPERPRRIGPALVPLGSISVLTLPGDNDTWSVTVFGPTRDAPLKALRDPATFTRVVAACPLQAHWLDGRPITDVLAMAGVLDCHRRHVVDGEPVVTGFLPVGDAWACTNPSAGRGLSVGLVHAQLLRAVVRDHPDDPGALVRAFDEATEQRVMPFYRNQIAADRARIAEMDALRAGVEPPPPDPGQVLLFTAAMYDPDVFRALMEIVTCLALPQEVLSRPGMRERVARFAGAPAPPPTPGPDRARLLDLLAG
ncbi:FAD-dependent oxidoreductase [Geodermatophilus sabuli]|uniref:2-polyprenyl-6-methoxyphenol hydroxylase n=1 Tax=Geodermatophilus sabuli TaxID=1564158 RepID=A0A285EIG2_9ACTN|nr:FAD-dependent oxidoreductase [Geodermatophilus sabuli]MBB3086532.1 2-polyprenyl-6-methoxyphenol hydroxylase-like FAD-dependent oxidoreductase [Geodermatophilus sabuli]SNX97816.1 2-polyprenyl-6-methoxyphenol hydroxylase [Geodermatophilus sabuli]